jgi:hypothetical protein
VACAACVRAAAVRVRLHSLAPVGLDHAAHAIDGRVDELVAEGLNQAAAHLVRVRARVRARARARARVRVRVRVRVRARVRVRVIQVRVGVGVGVWG